MPYIQAKDFRKGLDRRRQRVSGEPGTLWDIANAHINRGGDVERAKRFAPAFTLPSGTFGLAQVNGQLYVFGSQATPVGMPVAVQYQQLAPGDGATMTRVLDSRSFDGTLFVGAEYDNGNIGWFYGGTRITSLDTLADANASFSTLANYLADKINTRTDCTANSFGQTVVVTAKVPGTGFTLSATAINNGADATQNATVTTLQANVAAVAEVQGSGSIKINPSTYLPGVNRIVQVSVSSIPLLTTPLDFGNDTNATAAALALAINDAALSTYVATALGDTVTLTAPAGSGAGANGTVIAATVGGTVTVATANVSGGISAVAAVAQVTSILLNGNFEALDTYTITINGTAYVATGRASGHMTSAFVYKKRIYGVANSLMRYCAIGAPTDWTTATPASGSSFINLNSDSEGSERLVGIEQYQTYVSIFSRRRITLYALNTDATTNTFVQTLQNTGTVASRSVVAYGNTDVFYLDETGIRSIKARDASNAAFVSDVGTNIDTFVRDYVNSISADAVRRSIGLVEPIDGRFWLAMGSRIWVLSYYPSSKIEAWSYYDLGANIDGMVRAFNQIYVRLGNSIKLYGGVSGVEYPQAGEQVASIKLPFLNADDPGALKKGNGYDIACQNEWTITILPDPSDETKTRIIGRPTTTTYVGPGADLATALESNVAAFEFTCAKAGYATLSAFSYYFTKGQAA